jgi:hypothetical protein
MRLILISLSLAAVVLGTGAASAEKRIFVIANHADGYGVDRCLASEGTCGATIANSYCRSRDFDRAVSYRKVERDDIVGAAPVVESCRGGACVAFIAIECVRAD